MISWKVNFLDMIYSFIFETQDAKRTMSLAPKSFNLGASETRFHPNLLLHFICLYSALR
ncbi:unknown protein [Streptococcus thermophilus CNRZ1066]|nr:unknown protein [Streptococcus thermophilus CNRZ1066]